VKNRKFHGNSEAAQPTCASLLRRAQELVAQDVKPFLRRRVEQTLLRHLGAMKSETSRGVDGSLEEKKNTFVPAREWEVYINDHGI